MEKEIILPKRFQNNALRFINTCLKNTQQKQPLSSWKN